jgi:hypothetical protein
LFEPYRKLATILVTTHPPCVESVEGVEGKEGEEGGVEKTEKPDMWKLGVAHPSGAGDRPTGRVGGFSFFDLCS